MNTDPEILANALTKQGNLKKKEKKKKKKKKKSKSKGR